MEHAQLALGLLLLFGGGEILIRGSVSLADHWGVSPLLVGATVVAFGTSAPEFAVCLNAGLTGHDSLAIGNVVGSNIANILLVLGLSALCLPLHCDPAPTRRDLWSLLLASALALLALGQSTVERWMGLVLTVGLAAYLALLVATSRSSAVNAHEGADAQEGDRAAPGITAGLLWSGLSIAMLLGGAHLLVSGALAIAVRLGVSDSVIGLSLVALGTSLPELAVALLALVRRSAEVAVGNIVGSTLFNLLGILGVTALVSPLAVPESIARFDMWIMLAAILAFAAVARTGWRITRLEGAALLAGYPLYLAVLAP